jgi:hypothetical protein
VPSYLTSKEKYSKYLSKIKYLSTYKKYFVEYKKKDYIRNQVEALRLSKSMTVQEVIDYCKKTNKGEMLQCFLDVKKFDKSAEKLYNRSMGILASKRLKYNGEFGVSESLRKSTRLSKKSATRYLKYLALMSTISTRVGRPIEIHSGQEFVVFKAAYSFFNKAAISLGWLLVNDPTFCIGVRSRSYVIRVLANKDAKVDKDIQLNNIEEEFYKNKNDVSKKFWVAAKMDSIHAADFIHERAAIIDRQFKFRAELKDFKR